MGLNKDSLLFFADWLAASGSPRPPGPAMLCYGVQRIGFSHDEAVKALFAGKAPVSPGPSFDHWAFFSLLGFSELHALDITADMGATHLHDLNTPVPESLQGRYDMILDGGVTEHVFDPAQTLKNTLIMLKDGGWAAHILPMNDMVDHGFYQFSPGLLFDFYGANGFDQMTLRLVSNGRVREFGPRDIVCRHLFKSHSVLYFTACKAAFPGRIAVPTQFCYAPHVKGLTEAVGERPLFIWGTGGGFRNVYGPWFEREGADLNMKGFLDSDPAKVGSRFLGHPVHPPAVLKNEPGAAVIVASTYWQEICSAVRSMFEPEETPVRLLK